MATFTNGLLADKVAVVTSGTSSMGAAAATYLAQLGATLPGDPEELGSDHLIWLADIFRAGSSKNVLVLKTGLHNPHISMLSEECDDGNIKQCVP